MKPYKNLNLKTIQGRLWRPKNASKEVESLKCTFKLKCNQLETTAAVCLKKTANDKLKTYVMNEDTLEDDAKKI